MDALIVAGMIFLFNTLSSESVFMDPKVRKDVKKYITDERRRNEILDLMHEYKEDYIIRRGIEKDMESRFEELYSDRTNDSEDFQPVIKVYMRTRTEKQNLYVEAIMKFKSLVTDSEWEQLLINIDKGATAYLKKADKTIVKYKKANSEISSGLNGAIENKELGEKAVHIMTEIDAKEMSILQKLHAFNYKDLELLRNRKTTKEAYKHALSEYNDLWQAYFDLYLDAYSRLSEVTTDEEWKIIRKYSKNIF
jgi:hypothetical protein